MQRTWNEPWLEAESQLAFLSPAPESGRSSPPKMGLLAIAFWLGMALGEQAHAGTFTSGPALAAPRRGHTATLLSNGRLLVCGGFSGTYLASAEVYDPLTKTWQSTSPLTLPRSSHIALLLPDGKVLVAGGFTGGSGATETAEIFDPAHETWVTINSMNARRAAPCATLLQDGKVLVEGGSDSGAALPSAEIYDPALGTWSLTGPMASPRVWHTASLLADGRVLVAGGGTNASGGNFLATAEVFDPVSRVWQLTGSLSTTRKLHTATLIPGGKVLIAGGQMNFAFGTSACEIYDAASGTWSSTGDLHGTRFNHETVLLPSGVVLVMGGTAMGNALAVQLSSAELFDPTSGNWTTTANMSTNRQGHTATILHSGSVIVVAGSGSPAQPYYTTTEFYDYASGTWNLASAMSSGHVGHTATLLPNARILVAAGLDSTGYDTASCEIFDPGTGAWSPTSPMHTARDSHTATLLVSGKLLITGGYTRSGPTNAAEVYNFDTGTWTNAASMRVKRDGHTATLMLNGTVLVTGGAGPTNSEIYDPQLNTWAFVGRTISNYAGHSATLLQDGRVLVAGGSFAGGVLQAGAEIYNPSTKKWTRTGTPTFARQYHTATLLENGSVLVTGGTSNYYSVADASLAAAELYSPSTGTWTPTGPLSNKRFDHSALLLPNGKVLVAGGTTNDALGGLVSTEMYDPLTGAWTSVGNLNGPRYGFRLTRLPDGRVLATGGGDYFVLASAEVFDVGLGFSPAWRPVISTTASSTELGASIFAQGSNYRGVSEASSSCAGASPTDHPILQLMTLEQNRSALIASMAWSSNTTTSEPMWNFPQGYSLMTLIVNGIPSTSAVLRVTTRPVLPIVLTSPTMLPNSAFQFFFTNSPGNVFDVMASTNVTTPLSNWAILGSAIEASMGQFSFTDLTSTNSTKFYRARSE